MTIFASNPRMAKSAVGFLLSCLIPAVTSLDRNADHQTMEALAEDSGGKAFYDTNGLKEALARAIEYGSHYYTLAYMPTDKRMDGKYRRIQLKLSGGDYKVAYRRG